MEDFFYAQLYELAILFFVNVTEPMNDFVGIFPLIVFNLGQQVFVMFSKRILLTLPISLFDELISRHDAFDRKLSLWSYSVA